MKSKWQQRRDWVRNNSFHWQGRTRDGIGKWRGNRLGPPRLLSRALRVYGACAGIIWAVAMVGTLMGVWHAFDATLVFLIHAIAFSATGLWVDHIRKSLARLQSATELAQRMGQDPETIRRIAAQKEIKPRLNLNDDDLYDPDEFVDAVSLLRASFPPISPDTLVRPAMPDAASTAPATLLRATSSVSDSNSASSLEPYGKSYGRDESDQQSLLRG